ncbi:MAG TPA: hypothetical protein PK736_08475 [Bacteroidia bacterium]|nr:hypothetical protein [Bacteroidia bacterium]
MKDELIGYAKKLVLTGLLATLIIYLVQMVLPAKWQVPAPWVLVVFFFIMCLGFYAGLLFSSEGNPKGFVRFYMVGTFLKLLIFLGVIIFFGLIKPDFALGFTFNFFIIYLVFTVFEVAFLYQRFKKNE